jgi:hypothetical protein
MRFERFALAALFAVALWLASTSMQVAAAESGFVMGTMQPRDSFVGRVMDRIYAAAFRRIGVPLEVAVFPMKRLD